MMFFFLVILLVFVLLMMFFFSWMLKYFGVDMYDKLSSFECGFVSISSSKIFFSLQFFFISIVFLIFDVEIALILPIPVIFGFVNFYLLSFFFFFFLLMVLFGLYYEWYCGCLNWLY